MANVLDALTLKDTKTGKTTEYEIQDKGARAQIAAQVAASTDTDADYAAEVVDARVGADGESYASLGEAIRGQREKSKDEVTQLKGDLVDFAETCGNEILQFTKGYYINTSGSIVDINAKTASSNGWAYAIADCKEGDVFIISGLGGGSPRLWCFIDANGTVLSNAKADEERVEFIRVAPKNASKLIVNDKSGSISYKGYSINSRISANKNGISKYYEEIIVASSGSSVYATPTHLLKGRKYKFTNNTSSGCNVDVVDSNNVTTTLTTNLGAGKSYIFICDSNDYVKIGGYFAGSGSALIESVDEGIYSVAEEISHKLPHIIEVGVGKEFTSILDAALYAKAYPNSNLTIKVYSGIYDIIQEFKDKYGENYFTNMTKGEYGIPVGFGETWIFSPNAFLSAIYTGTNEIVHNSFCVFYFAQGGGFYDCTMVGLNINAQNIKYAIHDEMEQYDKPYTHTFRNCQIVMNQQGSSSWTEDWWSTKCIGGGLGKSGNIIIDGCYFRSNAEFSVKSCVSYHNSDQKDAMNFVTITNSYCYGNTTFRFGYCGKSTNITKCIIANNSVGQTPYKTAETQDSVDNIELLEWNNHIHS